LKVGNKPALFSCRGGHQACVLFHVAAASWPVIVPLLDPWQGVWCQGPAGMS